MQIWSCGCRRPNGFSESVTESRGIDYVNAAIQKSCNHVASAERALGGRTTSGHLFSCSRRE